jgi:RNA polymerase sigma-70 factor (ECF subfamily)
MKIVQNMPDGYRTVFNMYIIDDMSHQEIAQSLRINEATSRSQLFKARNYIRTTLINQKKITL